MLLEAGFRPARVGRTGKADGVLRCPGYRGPGSCALLWTTYTGDPITMQGGGLQEELHQSVGEPHTWVSLLCPGARGTW